MSAKLNYLVIRALIFEQAETDIIHHLSLKSNYCETAGQLLK
jgi:hypothetical protein